MVKRIIPPYEGPPISRPISVQQIPTLPHYIKTGGSIGFPRTFDEDVWEDENKWNNESVWGDNAYI